MSIDVTVHSPTDSYESFRSIVWVFIEAPHPGMGPGHTMPELDPVDCSRLVEIDAG